MLISEWEPEPLVPLQKDISTIEEEVESPIIHGHQPSLWDSFL